MYLILFLSTFFYMYEKNEVNLPLKSMCIIVLYKLNLKEVSITKTHIFVDLFNINWKKEPAG